jgi:hypothetical protein
MTIPKARVSPVGLKFKKAVHRVRNSSYNQQKTLDLMNLVKLQKRKNKRHDEISSLLRHMNHKHHV